jgi:hypothetical protein
LSGRSALPPSLRRTCKSSEAFFYLANNATLRFQFKRGFVGCLLSPALHDLKPHLTQFFNGTTLGFIGSPHVSWHDAQEISTMLAIHTTTDWTVRWKQQGESQLLRRQLQRRFGTNLPDWVNERLDHADTDQLETWGEALLDARTLEAVFGEK